MHIYLIYVAIGVFAGFLSGLLGISGGVLTVPLLVTTFGMIGFPDENSMHVAIGTSLAAMVFNSISSSRAHIKRKGVVWPLVLKMIPGIVVGVVFGAFTAYLLSDEILESVFALFLLLLSLYYFFKKEPHAGEHKLPKSPVLVGLGAIVGYISNILGVGGGIFCVPLFTYFRLPFVKAIGTSIIAGFVISFLGAVSYLFFGMNVKIPYPHVYGYIYLPAFLIIGVISFFIAPYGARISHAIPHNYLRKAFAVLLLLMSSFVYFF